MESLVKSFRVPVAKLLQASKLQGALLHVGTVHVRVACVVWHAQPPSPSSASGSLVAAGPSTSRITSASSLAPSTRSPTVRSRFANFDPEIGSNPYDVLLRGSFVQYVWEAQEHYEIKKKVDALTIAYDTEKEQESALDLVRQRVEGRRLELSYAMKRQRELEMLEGLTTFVSSQFERSSVLRDFASNRLLRAEQSALVWFEGGRHSVLKMLVHAAIPAEDRESLMIIREAFEVQLELLDVWSGGFDLARLAGKEEEAKQKEIKREISRKEKTLGQGGQAHWDYFRLQKRKLATLEAVAYGKKDALHSGMLRRYNSALGMLRSLDEALRSMLPLEYRNARMVSVFTIGHYFKKWLFTHPDYKKHAKGVSGQMLEYVQVTLVGRKALPRAKLAATVTKLDRYGREEQKDIVDEAKGI